MVRRHMLSCRLSDEEWLRLLDLLRVVNGELTGVLSRDFRLFVMECELNGDVDEVELVDRERRSVSTRESDSSEVFRRLSILR